MIARLRGRIEDKGEGRLILMAGGVGYGLAVPELVLQRLPASGEEATLEVYTHVREDQISLFGFSQKIEKDAFEILLSANGVGPKLALSILSQIPALDLLEAVVTGDRSRFSGISGVGKKTVEKLLLEIRERCEKRLLMERGTEKEGRKTSQTSGGASLNNAQPLMMKDLTDALLALGYREAEAQAASREALGRETITLDDALRFALRWLSGGKRGPTIGPRGTA
jgi:holliday junction DNA helicase RuvA